MLSSKRAVLAAVSFSNVTEADWEEPALDSGVTERDWILPLQKESVQSYELGMMLEYSPEAEEVADLLLAGLAADALDVDRGRHGGVESSGGCGVCVVSGSIGMSKWVSRWCLLWRRRWRLSKGWRRGEDGAI